MTYCVARKGDYGVIMAADSAITGEEKPKAKRSSFYQQHGELDAPGPQRFVQEGKLKIEVIGDCALTYAGVVPEIDSFISEFKIWKNDRPALEAFKVTGAAQPPITSQIILGYYDNSEPKIAAFNAHKDGKVLEDIKHIAFGSLDPQLDRLTKTYLTSFERASNDPKRILVQTLALLQSYGIHHYLISDGVGGGFCGVSLTSEGIRWQPDILYLVTNKELSVLGMVGSFARNNRWCLFSSMGEAGTIAFTHEQPDCRDDEEIAKLKAFSNEMEIKNDDGRFEYICVLSLKPHSVTAIKMDEKHYHYLVCIDPRRDMEKTLGVLWSTELREMVGKIEMPEGQVADSGHITIRYIPFMHIEDPPPGFLEQQRAHGKMFPPGAGI